MDSTNVNTSIKDSGVKLSPKEMFFKYLVYLPWFIIGLAISITVAYLYIRYTVPLYNASLSILIKNERSRSTAPPEISLDNLMAARSSNLANEIMILKSVSLMNRVVKSLGLELEYSNEGKVKKSELYTYSPVKAVVLSKKDSTREIILALSTKNGKVIAEYNGVQKSVVNGEIFNTAKGDLKLEISPESMVEGYTYFIKWRPTWNVAGQLASGLDIKQQSRDASIVQINLICEIPDKGKAVLNQLVKEYDELNIEEKNRTVMNSLRFIDDRLTILTTELDKVEDNLQGFKQRTNVVPLDIQSSTEFGKLTQLRDELNETEAQVQVIDMVRQYVSNPSRKYELVPSSLGITDATLTSLIQTYNQLQLQREGDLRSIPATHPSIQLLESQLEKVRLSILENLANVDRNVKRGRTQLEREYNSFESSLTTIPAKQRELLIIEREKGIKDKLLVYLLQKREEMAITKASAVGSVTTIDPAVSWGPVSPKSSNIYRFAFILGIAIPLAIIYIKDLLNDKIINRSDITKATNTPIIGEIAHHHSMTRQFVVGMKDRSVLSEQFRIIRANLQFLLATSPTTSPVILVTSSIAGEGKTFGSMNMAAVWAVAGKKTVIIELDLRKPKVSKALSLQRDTGISNYVVGNIKKEDLPQPIAEVPNLYVIGAGPIPPNPSEMIMDSKMDELFAYLRGNFDIVIIDSAPIGLVSDSKILARFADATLYVVRQRYTVKKQLLFIEELYKQKILPNMGLIVNDVKIGGANSYYGYGYGYGYGYSYNYNYSYSYGEQEKKGLWQRIRDYVGL